jgi:hypothetical protein
MLMVNRGKRLFRLDADTHWNLGSRGIVQLGVENLPAVGIFDVPIIGLSTRGNLLAALHRGIGLAAISAFAQPSRNLCRPMPENCLHGGRDASGRLPEPSGSKYRRESGPARTTLIRQALPGRALSFFPPIFVPATRLSQRGSARRLARTGRTRTDRRTPCNSRPDWAGPGEAVDDDRRREVETRSGITRWDGGRRQTRSCGRVIAPRMARASRWHRFRFRRRICSLPGSLSRTRIRSAPTAIR